MAEQEIEQREEGDKRGATSMLTRPDRKLDVAQALKLRVSRHLTYDEIGAKLGFSGDSVARALRQFSAIIEEPETVKAYRENEAELLDALSLKIVAHMSREEVIAKASLNNSAFALNKVHEARRLIRGESTANVGIRTTLVLAAHGSGKASESAELDGD